MGNTSSLYNQFYFSNIATYLFSIIVDIDTVQSIGSWVAKIKISLVKKCNLICHFSLSKNQ